MAFHPTAALSFGAERPSYPVVDGDHLEPAEAAARICAGDSVHVADEEAARAILRAVGLTEKMIDFRMHVAGVHHLR